MTRSLAGVVKDIANLLHDSGLEEESNRFDRLHVWAGSAETAPERREVAITVLGLFRGMGSFNDLVIMKDGAVDQAASIAAILQSHFVRRYGNLLLLMKVSNALRVSSKWARCRLLMDFLPSPQTRSMGFLLGL